MSADVCLGWTAAAHAAVERAAEALDADVAAIVCGGELVVTVGYAGGSAPVAELAAVRPGVADACLQAPGADLCAATAATLVAKAASPEETFSAVAGEVAQPSGADTAIVLRYEADGSATTVRRVRLPARRGAGWQREPDPRRGPPLGRDGPG